MAEDSEKTDKELRDELAERIMEEESYKHLNLVLQAERRIIKLIFHENDRNKLLEKICSILIENRGYTCVWIITFTGKQKTISMAEAGISQGYDTLIKLAEDGNLPSCTKRSAGDPGMKIIRDMEKECKGCPIFRSEKSISALTTHFEYGDWSSGVMTVYLPSMFIDNVEEQNLLQEIISDIAFALQRIEESEKHKYAEMEFHEIERKYKTIIESSIDTIIQFDTEGNFLYINPAGCKMFGRSHEEFVQMKFENLFDEEWKDESREYMKTVLTGEYIKGEVSARHREGHKLWIELSMAPIYKKERIAGFMCILRDITKRKIDERNILESEARYHDLFENSLEGIALLDESSNPIDVNERACQILGYSKGELLSTNLASIIHPEDLKEKDHDAAMKQLLNGESINTIYRIRKKNGSYINIQLSTKMLDKGTFLNVVQDITDRIRIETEIKHKQDELAASEKKYRRLTECAKDMIYRMSIPDGRYDYVSPASIEITGYKPQEFYNSPILIKQILHPDWDDYFKNQWKKLIKGEMPPTYEYQIIHKSGETRWLNQRNVLIRDQENRPIAIEGIVSNITESKKVEEALRESERRLKEAEKLAGLGHWVLDIPTKKLFWSDGVYKIFERDLEDFKGSYRLFLDYVHPEDRSAVDEAYRGTLEQSPYFNIEHRILLGDGREKFVHEHGVTQYDDNKIPIQSSGTIQDISEHKQAEKILKNYHHELQTMVEAQTSELYAANKELEAFAYSVSHDLRAPLRAIHGFTQILLEDYIEKLDEEAMRLGRVIQDNASKMSRLIDDLLNFSRTGRKEMHFTLVDMKKIIRESYYEITDKEERDRIEFSLDNIIDSTGDINMLRQVWINLISNAVKFSSKKNLSQIVISCIEEEKKIIYKIEDNGVGFKMRYNEKLFGVFQRLHNDKEFEGTGVGLALCQRIIKRHGGEIWAESELNKGTAFYFTIPKRNIH